MAITAMHSEHGVVIFLKSKRIVNPTHYSPLAQSPLAWVIFSFFDLYVQFIIFVRIYYDMDTKLTLKLDSSVIENAKNYAKSKNVSLSQLIEAYLSLLTDPRGREDVTPLVKSLSGVIKLPKGYDPKSAYRKHLSDKYSR